MLFTRARAWEWVANVSAIWILCMCMHTRFYSSVSLSKDIREGRRSKRWRREVKKSKRNYTWWKICKKENLEFLARRMDCRRLEKFSTLNSHLFTNAAMILKFETEKILNFESWNEKQKDFSIFTPISISECMRHLFECWFKNTWDLHLREMWRVETTSTVDISYLTLKLDLKVNNLLFLFLYLTINSRILILKLNHWWREGIHFRIVRILLCN